MSPDAAPEWVLLSEAQAYLRRRMWASRRHSPVFLSRRRRLRPLILRAGYREERAGRDLREAFVRSEMALYVRPRAGGDSSSATAVPPDVVQRLVTRRGVLADILFRPPLGLLNDGRRALHYSLSTGVLVVCKSEFAAWCVRQRALKRWPSQERAKRPRGRGRPTKATPSLKRAILDNLDRGRWTTADGVAALWRLLSAEGVTPPTVTTLANIVDGLQGETSDPRLTRRRNRPRSP